MQFTLKRMLISVTLIAIGVCGAAVRRWLSLAQFDSLPIIFQIITLWLYWSCAAFVCGGIGCLFKRTLAGFVLGYVLFFAFGFILTAMLRASKL